MRRTVYLAYLASTSRPYMEREITRSCGLRRRLTDHKHYKRESCRQRNIIASNHSAQAGSITNFKRIKTPSVSPTLVCGPFITQSISNGEIMIPKGCSGSLPILGAESPSLLGALLMKTCLAFFKLVPRSGFCTIFLRIPALNSRAPPGPYILSYINCLCSTLN